MNIFKNRLIERKTVFLFFVVSLTIAVLTIMASDSFARLTSSFSQSQQNLDVLSIVFFTVLMYAIRYLLSDLFYNGLISRYEQKTYQSLHQRISASLVSQPYESNYLKDSEDTYNTIVNDSETVILFLSSILPDAILQFTTIALISVYLLLLDPVFFLIYILLTIISTFLQTIISKTILTAGKESKDAQVQLNKMIDSILNNRLVVKSYRADEFADFLLKPKQDDYIRKNVHVAYTRFPLKVVGIVCGLMPLLGISLYSLYMVPRGLINTATVLSAFYICQTIMPYQTHISDIISDIRSSEVSLNRIEALIEASPEENDNGTEHDGILLTDVDYTYPNTEVKALSGINLLIGTGEKIALVGKSGSGKSTLMKVLCGMITPDHGAVNIPECIFTQQFPYMFRDSIKNNIVFNAISNETDRYQNVLTDSCAVELIENQGNDFFLENNASNISGGQKQRIAIARALYTNRSTYIFDESLSALDEELRATVLDNILSSKKNDTVIFSLHQPELICKFDRVIVLSEGTITFDGAYDQYMAWKEVTAYVEE